MNAGAVEGGSTKQRRPSYDWRVAEEHILAAGSDHAGQNRACNAIGANTKKPDRTCRKASLGVHELHETFVGLLEADEWSVRRRPQFEHASSWAAEKPSSGQPSIFDSGYFAARGGEECSKSGVGLSGGV